MKKILIISFLFLSFNAFGEILKYSCVSSICIKNMDLDGLPKCLGGINFDISYQNVFIIDTNEQEVHITNADNLRPTPIHKIKFNREEIENIIKGIGISGRFKDKENDYGFSYNEMNGRFYFEYFSLPEYQQRHLEKGVCEKVSN